MIMYFIQIILYTKLNIYPISIREGEKNRKQSQNHKECREIKKKKNDIE